MIVGVFNKMSPRLGSKLIHANKLESLIRKDNPEI